VIAEGKSKQPDADVSERIAYPINQFGSWIVQTETSANRLRVGQGFSNFLNGIGGQIEIRVQEPKHFSSCDRGARVHLRRATLRRDEETVGPALGNGGSAIGTSTVDNDDLERAREGSRAPEKIVDQRRLI
jgi:hypothetical protein